MNVPVGGIAPIFAANEQRLIYNLITKRFHWQKPTPQDVRRSLLAMRRHAEHYHVPIISLPRIASGLDGLDWHNVVLPIIHDIFDASPVAVYIYTLPENGV